MSAPRNATAVRAAIDSLVEAVCELSKANRLTGIWDNRRFQLCKRPFEEIDGAYLYKTEKLSRKNVELRAKYRTAIDVAWKTLVDSLPKSCNGSGSQDPR